MVSYTTKTTSKKKIPETSPFVTPPQPKPNFDKPAYNLPAGKSQASDTRQSFVSPEKLNPIKDYVPEIIRDQDTGRPSGFKYPDGTTKIGLSPKEVAFLARKYGEQQTAPAGTRFAGEEAISQQRASASMVDDGTSPELISQIGQLTPEQQAMEGIPLDMEQTNRGNVLQTAKERAILGVVSGATGGAGVGAVAGGPIGAAIGAVGAGLAGGIIGGTSAIFQEYKRVDKINYERAAENYATARANLDQAIMLANKGAGYETNMLAVRNYNKALAQINMAERQLKELSKDQKRYTDEIKDVLNDIQEFKQNDRGSMDAELSFALKKPTKAYATGVQ